MSSSLGRRARPLAGSVLAPVVLLAGLASADEAPSPSGTVIRAQAAYLAHDLHEGREPGERGHELAELYVESRLRAFGLAPGAGDSYRQPVHFRRGRLLTARLEVGKRAARLEPISADELVLDSSAVHERVELRAPVVFAGFGISSPSLSGDDYSGVDARGKVVLLLSGAPATLAPSVRAHFSSRRTRLETAAAKGAVAVLTLSTRVDQKRRPWQRTLERAGEPVLRWLEPDGTAHEGVPSLQAVGELAPEAARRILASAGVEVERLLDAAERDDHAALAARELGLEVALTATHRHEELTSPNVLALLPGSDPRLSGELIVATAHLDHIGSIAPREGDSIANGFIDNALGAGILLELARTLAAAPSAPARPILFAFVTAEEPGLLGSDFLAQHSPIEGAKPVANLNLDAPLLLGPIRELVAWGAEHSTLGPLAEQVAERHGFRVGPDPMPAEAFFVRSDQYSFVRRGVPALFLDVAAYDATTHGVDDGSYLRDHYHQPSDDARLPIDWREVERFTRAQFELLFEVASAPSRPSWNPGDFYGELFGRRPEDRPQP